MKKCFACDKALKKEQHLVSCIDEQTVYVGPECFRKIKKAREEGYQPPLGGPRLLTLESKAKYQFLRLARAS